MKLTSSVNGFVKYTVKTTEETGMYMEKIVCDLVNVKFNSSRGYINEGCCPDLIKKDVAKGFKGLDIEFHTGNENKSFDFLLRDKKTLSLKTNINGSKSCPQTIGQTSLTKLNEKTGWEIKGGSDGYKSFVLDNKILVIQKYLEHLFCCDWMVSVNFNKGIICRYNGKAPTISRHSVFKMTKESLETWNESSTLKVLVAGKYISLAEFQVHNNRNVFKCRFNMECVDILIEKGILTGVCLTKMALENKYEIKIEKPGQLPLSFSYIGSKLKLLDFIAGNIESYICKSLGDINGFADIFSGTGVVGYNALKKGVKKLLSNDIQHYSYIVSSVWTGFRVDKEKILDHIKFINNLECNSMEASKKDQVYNNYTQIADRMYFTCENGYRIDKIRQYIENIKESLTINEYNLLIKILLYACINVANISSTFGAFLKDYKPTSVKKIVLKNDFVNLLLDYKNVCHQTTCMSAIDLLHQDCLSDYEVCYIDPPYNNRSYYDNYHFLESCSLYDNPELRGKTGLRNKELPGVKSFCLKKNAEESFTLLLSTLKSQNVFISYSSDSILSKQKMSGILEATGWKDVLVIEKDYKRFKSNQNIQQNEGVVEYLFCANRKNIF